MATNKKKGISAGLVLLVLVVLYLLFGRKKAAADTLSSAGIVGSTVNANPTVGGTLGAAKSVASTLGYTPDIARGEQEGYTTDVNIANDTNYPAVDTLNVNPDNASVDPSLLVSS